MTLFEILNSSSVIEEAKHTNPNEYERVWVEFPKNEKHYYQSGKRKYGKWVYKHKEKMGVKETKNLVVHHKDNNKKNNSKSNLVVVTRAEHCRIDPNARKFTDCKVKGCKNKHYSHHLCLTHYMQRYRSGKIGNYDKSKNYSKKNR